MPTDKIIVYKDKIKKKNNFYSFAIKFRSAHNLKSIC